MVSVIFRLNLIIREILWIKKQHDILFLLLKVSFPISFRGLMYKHCRESTEIVKIINYEIYQFVWSCESADCLVFF